jgi:hypothetical protein
MKYLRSYNESIRDLMVPKSEDEILKSLKGLSNSDLLKKSINNDFIKGVEIAFQNELTNADIKFIKETIYFIKNKEIIKLILEKVRNDLTEIQTYIIEKYKLGLHQNEEKEYEIWFKTMLTDLVVSRSKENSNVLIYKKDRNVLFNYNEKNRCFLIDYKKIWSVFESKYHINYNEIILLTRGIVEKHFNLKGMLILTTSKNIHLLIKKNNINI